MLKLTPIPALQTNYIWVITDDKHPNKAAVVDPGDAKPVLDYLQQYELDLVAILVTHHHYDHTDGIETLVARFNCPVIAGSEEPVSAKTISVQDGETFKIKELDIEFKAIHIPGHTLGHTAFYHDGLVFSGDTLFAAGCGRVFEGTPEQMYASLQKLMKLPPETKLYCGHEYTAQNLTFGLTVEPANQAIQDKLTFAKSQKCTLPSTLADERATNVFLRCSEASIIAAAEHYNGSTLNTPESVFATLREWKNRA